MSEETVKLDPVKDFVSEGKYLKITRDNIVEIQRLYVKYLTDKQPGVEEKVPKEFYFQYLRNQGKGLGGYKLFEGVPPEYHPALRLEILGTSLDKMLYSAKHKTKRDEF